MNSATLEHVFFGLQARLINFPKLSTINVDRINLNQVDFEEFPSHLKHQYF